MEKGQPVMNRLSRRNGVTKPRKSLHNNIEETLSVIERFYGIKESVDIFKFCQRRDVAAGGNYKIAEILAFIQQANRFNPYRLGRSVAKLLGGTDISHSYAVGWHLLQHIFHLYSIAEVKDTAAGVQDAVNQLQRIITAVVIDDDESLLLCGFHDFLYVFRGKFLN